MWFKADKQAWKCLHMDNSVLGYSLEHYLLLMDTYSLFILIKNIAVVINCQFYRKFMFCVKVIKERLLFKINIQT